MDTASNDLTISELAGRVRGEFMEMPGLRLNVAQAQRLWGLDALRCEAVLDTLVKTGVLACRSRSYSLRRSQP